MKRNLIISIFILLALMSSKGYCDNVEDATVFYNEAIDLYKQDEIDKSIELFKKAIELNPNFYEAHYNIAQILMSLDKNEEALKSLEDIYKINPKDTETLYNLGKIEYKRGYLSKSHGYLSKIPTDAPQYNSAKLLIEKIEKRQKELNLESKINTHAPLVDQTGKAHGDELAEFKAPSGIAVDSRGNIYVASFLDNTINKISIYGQKSVVTRSSLIRGPIGIAIDKNNNIYVANYNSNNIVKITPANNVSIFADVQKPYCINYDEDKNRLYVTEQGTNKLIKFDL